MSSGKAAGNKTGRTAIKIKPIRAGTDRTKIKQTGTCRVSKARTFQAAAAAKGKAEAGKAGSSRIGMVCIERKEAMGSSRADKDYREVKPAEYGRPGEADSKTQKIKKTIKQGRNGIAAMNAEAAMISKILKHRTD